jgi:DNA helicase-4
VEDNDFIKALTASLRTRLAVLSVGDASSDGSIEIRDESLDVTIVVMPLRFDGGLRRAWVSGRGSTRTGSLPSSLVRNLPLVTSPEGARWEFIVDSIRDAVLEVDHVAVQSARAREARELRRQQNVAREAAAVRAREDAERLRVEERARQTRRVAELADRLGLALERDFLTADRALDQEPEAHLLGSDARQAMKRDFVKGWAQRELGVQLDDQQAGAVAAVGGDVKVTARAGAGTTRSLTTRALFLQRHCRVAPNELLLLAFNRKAALEMRERVRIVVGDDVPHVMTFHALAHAIVHPDEDLVYDDRRADQFGLSREVQEVIDAHIRSAEHGDRIRDLMLAYFRDDWERIVDGGIMLTIDDFLAYRRALPRETLKGDMVKSLGEREIANTMFENDVRYAYEWGHRWGRSVYRPDFTVPTPGGGVIIEYFGLVGDQDYDEQSAAKRDYWENRQGWTLLEYTPQDLCRNGRDAFRTRLLGDLRALGVPTRAKTEEEIWQEVRQRALDRFTETMTGFIGKCRKRDLAPSDLAAIVAAHVPATESEALFLGIATTVHAGYLARLAEVGKIDFDGLLWRAVQTVRNGETTFIRDRGRENGDLARLRFILVDEFQDFSDGFFQLLSAIRAANPRAEFFCVGDDWQAINGFAGSDLRYFSEFGLRFRQSTELRISTNYRSAVSIVRVGNAVMRGQGDPATAQDAAGPGRVWVCPLEAFIPSAAETERHGSDQLTPAVLRIVQQYLADGLTVTMLSRTNHVRGYVKWADEDHRRGSGIDRFLAHIRSFLPEEDGDLVHISTAHRYKGLEQPAVVVLDALDTAYPLIHPAWVFQRALGDSIEKIESEERRLFYVAVTRAAQSLALLTRAGSETPYLRDIRLGAPIEIVRWETLAPAASTTADRLEIRVRNAYEVRDQLKDLRYAWNADGSYWCRSVPSPGFSFDALLRQPWAAMCGSIMVLSATGAIMHERGTWADGTDSRAADIDRRAADMLGRLGSLPGKA